MAFKILSLDGGGTWSLIQVRALMDLYKDKFGPDMRGHEVLGEFDLVAANSGGSIVAAGLMANYKLAEILALFRDQNTRFRLFHFLPWYKRKLSILKDFGVRFSTQDKFAALKDILGDFGDTLLPDVQIKNERGRNIQFLIATFDYDRERVKFMRSNSRSLAASSGTSPTNFTVAQAVHASSTAPVDFFDEPAVFGRARFWDGAIAGFNNPVLAAVVEALAYLDDTQDKAQELYALAIGSGNTFLPLDAHGQANLEKPREDPGTFTDLNKLARSIVSDPPDSDTFIAYIMMGGRLPPRGATHCLPSPRLIRMNPLVQPRFDNGAYRLPSGLDPAQFKHLVEMDLAAIYPEDITLLDHFCDLWLKDDVLNQPIRASSALVAEIGHSTYTDAKADFQGWPR